MIRPGDFGVMIFRGHRPMPSPCADCPFKLEREGQNFLHPERMEAIKLAATLGQSFHCHKTVFQPDVESEPDGERPMWHPLYRQCAGANEWARELARELGVEPVLIGEPFAD